MVCYQDERTAAGRGCAEIGRCGQRSDVAPLQDLLHYVVKGLSQVAVEGRKFGVNDRETNRFTRKAIFSTLTNADFDPERLVDFIHQAVEKRESLKDKVKAAGGQIDFGDGPSTFEPGSTCEALVAQGHEVVDPSDSDIKANILALREILIDGIRGIAACADYAAILGKEDDSVYVFIQEGLASTLKENTSIHDSIALVLKCGEVKLKIMEMLDVAVAGTYGHSRPTA